MNDRQFLEIIANNVECMEQKADTLLLMLSGLKKSIEKRLERMKEDNHDN